MTVRSHWGRVMSLPDPVAELRGHAGGIYTYRAAVELVVDHDVFLGRSAFRDEFVGFVRGCAYVRWGAVVTALNQHRLPCSSSEAGVLRIAASLGGDVPVRLGRVLGGVRRHQHRADHGRDHCRQRRPAAPLPRRHGVGDPQWI